MKIRGGINWEDLKYPRVVLCLLIMKYFTLEDRHKIFYYYHPSLLNYFRNNKLHCLLFYFLHSMETSIKDALDPQNKGKPPISLYKGLKYMLYDYHLSLYPPRNIMLVQLSLLASLSLVAYASSFSPIFFHVSSEAFASYVVPSSSITII